MSSGELGLSSLMEIIILVFTDQMDALSQLLVQIHLSQRLVNKDCEKRICELAQQLVEYVDLNCTSIQMVYANQNGVFKLLCDFRKKPVEYDELMKYVEQLDEEDLPLDYIEWRDGK